MSLLKSIYEGAKKVVTFNIRDFTKEKVYTGTLPISGTSLSPSTTLKVGSAVGKVATTIAKSPVKTAKTLITVPIVAGVLTTSKKAQDIVKGAINPTKNLEKGKTIGELIEKPKEAGSILGINKDSSVVQNIIKGAKTAGVVGAVAGAGALAVAGAKKVKEKLASAKTIEQAISSSPSNEIIGAPVFTGGVPTAPAVSSLPSVEAVPSPVKEKPMSVSQRVNIKIDNKRTKRYKKEIFLITQ